MRSALAQDLHSDGDTSNDDIKSLGGIWKGVELQGIKSGGGHSKSLDSLFYRIYLELGTHAAFPVYPHTILICVFA